MLRKILKFSIVYLILDGMQRGLLLLLTPVFAHYMNPMEVGEISLGSTLITIMTVILGSSLGASVSRYYGRLKGNKIRLEVFLGTLYGMGILASLFGLMIVLLLPQKTYDLFLPGFTFYGHIVPIGLTAVLNSLILIFVSNLKAAQHAKNYVVFGSLSLIAQSLLIYLFVIQWGYGAKGYFWSQAILNTLLIGAVFIFFLRGLRFHLTKKYVHLILRYSLPQMPVDAVGFVNSYVDRVFIVNFLGLYSVGIYHVGLQFSLIIYMVLIAINSATVPLFFKAYDRGKEGLDQLQDLFKIFVYGASLLAFGMIILAPHVLRTFFSKEYWEAEQAIPLLCFNYAILSVYFFSTNALSTKPSLARYRFLGIVVGALVNLAVGFGVIRFWGLLGASIATSAGQLAMTLFFSWMANRKTKVTFPSIWGVLVLSMATFGAVALNQVSKIFVEGAGAFSLKVLLLSVASFSFLRILWGRAKEAEPQ